MSWWDLLEKLRSKPESARRQIALFAAAGATLFIVVLWWLGQWFIAPPLRQAPPAEPPPPLIELWREAKLRIQTGWQTIINQNPK